MNGTKERQVGFGRPRRRARRHLKSWWVAGLSTPGGSHGSSTGELTTQPMMASTKTTAITMPMIAPTVSPATLRPKKGCVAPYGEPPLWWLMFGCVAAYGG
jgi:hypothetical protein